MRLFSPKWMSRKAADFEKAKASILKTTDEEKLAKIAKEAPLDNVALFTIEQISNETLLKDVALRTDYDKRGYAAIKKIVSQDMLTEITLDETANVCVRCGATEHISDVKYLEMIAQKAMSDDLRLYALCRLREMYSNYDFSPYRELIDKNIRDISDSGLAAAVKTCEAQTENNRNSSTCAFVSAVKLCEDLSLLNAVYERITGLEDLKRQSKTRIKEIFKDSAESLARKQLPTPQNVNALESLRYKDLITYEEYKQIMSWFKEILLPYGATQQEIFSVACNYPFLISDALDRLTDETLLSEAVINNIVPPRERRRIIEKIKDPNLLSQIASSQKTSYIARAMASRAANIWNPFGSRTLVCRRCRKPAFYEVDYSDHGSNSYRTEKRLFCRTCGNERIETLKPKVPLEEFIPGDEKDLNLRDKIVFLCPRCGNPPNGTCFCTPKPSPLPVVISPDSLKGYGDVELE